MVNKIEGLLQTLYNYFFNSPKKHLKFMNIMEILEMKRAKHFEKCENPSDIYVVSCLMCDGGI